MVFASINKSIQASFLAKLLLTHVKTCRRLHSLGLVKTCGPDDMRTELKDVSVFRMDVHMPKAPQARLQVSLEPFAA